MLPCRQTSSILANKLQPLTSDGICSTRNGLRVLFEKVDFHLTGAHHHHNNRFCTLRVNYLLWIDDGGTVVENCLNCTVLLPPALYRAGLPRISALV